MFSETDIKCICWKIKDFDDPMHICVIYVGKILTGMRTLYKTGHTLYITI